MESCTLRSLPKRVALLAEGVDRNSTEMLLLAISEVALLAEGVDRNWIILMLILLWISRPPRGGRG